MKRWILLALLGIVIGASFLVLRLHMTTTSPEARNHLVRTSNSAAKYLLCAQAFAFTNENGPFKTDFTFHDPFRNTSDTIIPLFLKNDVHDQSVSFSVEIIVAQVATFNESISQVREQDGISVLLPDAQNQLQRSNEPQFIIFALDRNRMMAILDYTCPAQWVWKSTTKT